MDLYLDAAQSTSRIVTKTYSTSFSLAVSMLDQSIRSDIYNIYGFVRLADEIVDTFHDHQRERLLAEFQADTFIAIRQQMSLNPILFAFQKTVNAYEIDLQLIKSFFRSMEMDLKRSTHDKESLKGYIYGSAEVVGLMCLHVFVGRDKEAYKRLENSAKALGAAFQKINFLRDIKFDLTIDRKYYPDILTASEKEAIEKDIEVDLNIAWPGILQLPENCRFGVRLAYEYFNKLFRKIRSERAEVLISKRIRVPNYTKLFILVKILLFGTTNKSSLSPLKLNLLARLFQLF